MYTNLGMNYDEFIEKAEEEHKKFIYELDIQGEIDMTDENLEKINNIKHNLDILVFTETRCKDSATTMPFLMKLCNMNNNIKVKFFRMKGNEDLVEDLIGEKRIPSIVILDKNKNVRRKYIEFPYKVKKILENSSIEDTQLIIDSMRGGDFNKEIQADLIKFISGKDYKYISFQRKDK